MQLTQMYRHKHYSSRTIHVQLSTYSQLLSLLLAAISIAHGALELYIAVIQQAAAAKFS